MAADLTKVAVTPGADPQEVVRSLRRFVGRLRVHATMETDALYPSLLEHADPDVRASAGRLYEDLGPLYGLVDEFVEKWGTSEQIESGRIRFRIELARVIGRLGWRMMREDRELYPMADALD